MDADLSEGEPDRAEDLRRDAGRRGRSTSWPRRAAGSLWTWLALCAAWAALAYVTGWTWATGLSFLAIVAGYSWSATRARLNRPRRARRTGRTRTSRRTSGTGTAGLTLHARRADIALLAWKSLLSRPVYTGGPRRALRSSRTGRPLRSLDIDADGLRYARHARRGDDAVDDSTGEGQGR